MHDLILRWTVRVAFACYIAALALRIPKAHAGHREQTSRILWTIGCAVFLVHVWAAFQFVHHWSHADAWRETARQTQAMTGFNSGAGLWLNYVFAAIWLIDVLMWWIRKAPRSLPIEIAIQTFFAFMWINATIVFGHGFARWMGVTGGLVLLGISIARRPSSN